MEEKEITSTVAFEGKEAEALTFKELETVYKMMEGGVPEVYKIVENLTKEKADKLMANVEKLPDVQSEHIILYGIRVENKKYVPLDELWFVDKAGKVIKKFKL